MKVLDVQQTKPTFELPAGSCDCHIHLFGPQQQYPSVPNRSYTPPFVGLDDLSVFHTAIGLERAVVVQASVQGTNNSFLLEALSKWPTRLRGVAVIGEGVSDDELRAMNKAGVRGVRLNFFSHGVNDPVVVGKRLAELAKKVAPLGWHIQMYVSSQMIADLSDQFASLPCPVVFDHFGSLNPSTVPDHPHFKTVLALVKTGKVYVKLSAFHRITSTADYEDVQPLAVSLVKANPDRMLWGSDWPHVLAYENRLPVGPDPLRPEDDGANINRLTRWIPDRDLLQKIFVENPASLYGF